MRRAQAAMEYLFMVAAALLVVLMVIKTLKEVAVTAVQHGENASREITETLRQMAGTDGEGISTRG